MSVHECDDCGAVWPEAELLQIKNLEARLDAGGVVPSGECPTCGALCYPKESEDLTRQFWTLTLAHQEVNRGAVIERQILCPTCGYAIRMAKELAGQYGLDVASVEDVLPKDGVLYDSGNNLFLLTRLK